METQLIRLDPPYKLICNKDAKFGLHIATMIVINYNHMSDMCCFPVVEQKNEPGGEVWNDSELETCKVICRYGENISLHIFKEIMEYYYGWSYIPTDEFVWDLKKALMNNGSKIILPKTDIIKNTPKGNNYLSEYEIELIFDNDTDSEVCTIYSSYDSYFFFLESIDYNPGRRAHPGKDEETTIYSLALLRDAYLTALDKEGVTKITFYTNDKDYRDYVEKLNNYHDILETSFICDYLNRKCRGYYSQEAFKLSYTSNESNIEVSKKKARKWLSAYFMSNEERKEEANIKMPKIFHDNLDVDKIKTKLSKIDRTGCGPKQFCSLAKDFFASIGWLPIQIDTNFVSWMKYNNIVDMKDKGLTHVTIDDNKANNIKLLLKNTFQFKNEKGIWEDKVEFYLPNRQKVNNGE